MLATSILAGRCNIGRSCYIAHSRVLISVISAGGSFALTTKETENAIRGARDRAVKLFDEATKVRTSRELAKNRSKGNLVEINLEPKACCLFPRG